MCRERQKVKMEWEPELVVRGRDGKPFCAEIDGWRYRWCEGAQL